MNSVSRPVGFGEDATGATLREDVWRIRTRKNGSVRHRTNNASTRITKHRQDNERNVQSGILTLGFRHSGVG